MNVIDTRQVALKNVIDDFAQYAVQQNLLDKVETLFPPSVIFKLEEGTIEDIAGETEDSKKERVLYSRKLTVLNKAMGILQKLDRGDARIAPIAGMQDRASTSSDGTMQDGDTEVDLVDGEDPDSE